MLISPEKKTLEIYKQLPTKVLLYMKEDLAYFINVAFNEFLWSKQLEVVYALQKYKKVCVRSCFSVGKSFLASRIAIAFSQTHPNSIVAITAPTFNQVKNIIFREIHVAHAKSRIKLLGEPTTIEWNVTKGKWYMTGFSTDKPDRVQGKHSKSLLAIVDESSGVEDNIIEAVESWGASGDSYELLIGNPLRASGKFYNSFFDPAFYKINISAYGSPNFTGEYVPEYLKQSLINKSFVDMIIQGHGKDSAYYKIAVLGEFPSTEDNNLFDSKEITRAMEVSNIVSEDDSITLTADIAYTGADLTVIIAWRGNNVIAIHKIRKNDVPEVTGWLINYYKEYHAGSIIIDSTGFGVGVYDLLKDDYPVMGVNFGTNAIESNKYTNIRTEMYFNLFYAFRDGKISIPKNEDIRDELLVQAYSFDKMGRFALFKKSLLKPKLGRSPDIADALALKFAPTTNIIGIA